MNTSNTRRRALIMAGGTGGHVFPGLAVAQALIKEQWEVAWLGTPGGMEAELIKKTPIPFKTISVAGLRRKGFIAKFCAPFMLIKACLQALKILWLFKPQLVVGMGGFVAGPGGLAAWALGYPLVIHEQNAIPGMTNRLLSRFAARVLEGFPESFPPAAQAVWTGNPVREEVLQIPSPAHRALGQKERLHILIIGGSRGAEVLNLVCPEALDALKPRLKEKMPEIWHQTGNAQREHVAKTYEKIGVNARTDAFIHEISEAYLWADLVICRAGASTIAELSVVGIPSILIPFPFAVDDHQSHNASFLEREGAAKICPQALLSGPALADMIVELSQNPETLLHMATAAKRVSSPEALSKVLANCLEVSSATQKN